MTNPNIGNGVGYLYAMVGFGPTIAVKNTSENLAAFGKIYLDNPRGIFGILATVEAPAAPVFMPDTSVEIETEDLQEIARVNLLGINPS